MNGSKNISLNKRNGALLKFLIGAGALFLFIAAFNFFSLPVKNIFYAVSAPMQKKFWSAGESSAGFLSSFWKAGFLQKENQDLKTQIQKLQSQNAIMQAALESKATLAGASFAYQDTGYNLLMAGAIGLDEQDMLSIDKGSSENISEGMPVVNQYGAILGKVYEVYKNFSKVMLISNKNSVISVKVRQQNAAEGQDSEIDGVIRGTGKMGVYLDLVPVDDKISEGDLLLTSALEETFPKNLLVGTVSKIQKNDQSPHQQAQVKPFLDSSIDNVFVIKNYKR